jgi:L-amino acid N-acyltransferase YncA
VRHLVRAATPKDLRWLSHWADCVLSPEAVGFAAVDAHGRTRGAVAFDEVTADSCRAHQAGTPQAVRALLDVGLRFPFEGLGVAKLVGTVASTNARALRFNARLGFKVVRVEADGFGGGVDRVWMELRREGCRYLRREEAGPWAGETQTRG